MEPNSQYESSNQESTSRNDSKAEIEVKPSPSLSAPRHRLVVEELQRMTPATIGQVAAPVLEEMNLLDVETGGAEMIGTPIFHRLWNEQGELTQPFARLVTWFVEERKGCRDPLYAAAFIVRMAAVVATVEEALNGP